MDIARLIESSYNEAVKALTMGTSRHALARARERAFTKTLIAHLKRQCEGDDLRLFASWQRANVADFGTNRLLYEIALCRIGKSQTAERKSEAFLFISSALWQIEIDFSREWRSALYAINRLNCGAAAEKLLILPLPRRGQSQLLNTLRAPAAASSGRLYLALVPHPGDWDEDVGPPQVWLLGEDEWLEMS